MKTVTISTEEYRRLLQSEDLAHRQRFTIKNLERELERQKVRGDHNANPSEEIQQFVANWAKRYKIQYEAQQVAYRYY